MRFQVGRLLAATLIVALVSGLDRQCLPPNLALAQEPVLSPRQDLRTSVDTRFEQHLKTLANELRSQENENAAQVVEGLALPRDAGRIYLFLPTATEEQQTAPWGENDQEWSRRVQTAKRQYAVELFELAGRLAKDEQGAEAYQLIHEALYWDPQFSAARRLLGHRQTDQGWQPYSEKQRVRTAAKDHPLTRWKAGEYQVIVTDDFEIATNADPETASLMAEKLQRWQWVWRQVFFDYWSNSRSLARCLDDQLPLNKPSRKFEVVFFKDRANYLAVLSEPIPGVEVSSGYYSDQHKTSFFYASEDAKVEETWRHELTHQLFKESIPTTPLPFEARFLWLGEGIAMYMESLQEYGAWVTLGGFDARRLQYAKTRRFREDYHLPVEKLNQMSRAEIQESPDITRIYSEVAGIVHFLMHADGGRYRARLVSLLELIYRGKLKPEKFADALGITPAEIDRLYPDFLRVPPDLVDKFLAQPERITELSLVGSRLTDRDVEEIGKCHQLTWLDLSGSTLSPNRVQHLGSCQQLDQLYLTGSPIEPESLRALSRFPKLVSLDLAGTVLNQELGQELGDLQQLQNLSLAYSTADDALVPALAQLTNLKVLDLSGTRLSGSGFQTLRMALPKVQIIQGP